MAAFTEDERKEMAAKGIAMPDGSFPIPDKQHLISAIHMVGLAGPDKDRRAIRRHIIRRAEALGLRDLIPAHWHADGSVDEDHRSLADWRELRLLSAAGMTARPFAVVEMRAASDSTVEIEGYAAVFGTPYRVADFAGEYTEQVRAGAFSKTLREADVPLLIGHAGMALARTRSGTLVLEEDTHGLHVQATLDTRQGLARDLAVAIERRDMDSMSFAFSAIRQQWSADYEARTLLECRLHDVSVVAQPANPATTVGLRSALAWDSSEAFSRAAAELREGKKLSAATLATLADVLDLIATADRAVDAAQPMLADLMGVPNPDDPDQTPETPSSVTDGSMPRSLAEALATADLLRSTLARA